MPDEHATEETSIKTGSGKKIILLILLGILLLGGGGGAAWWFMGGQGESSSTREVQAKTDGAKPEQGPIMELEPFLLNLADRDDLRFLKVSIKLELDRAEDKTDFHHKVPAIRDALLVLLSSKESQLLRTVNGKRRVREEIMTRVNGVMNHGQITNVYFTDFIIQ
jgi:flagellar protein FliL